MLLATAMMIAPCPSIVRAADPAVPAPPDSPAERPSPAAGPIAPVNPASTATPPPVKSAPPSSVAPSTAAPAPAPSSPQTFSVLEYQVEGNTLLAPIDIERAVTPFLGDNKSVKDVEAARAKLEGVYHDRGYKTVLVNIPQQKIGAGVVRLTVLEGAVGTLTIKGSRYHSLQVLRDKLAEVNPNTVPNFNELQKEMGDVNRSADLRVTPVLRASQTPGRVDVDLSVEDELPLHALLDVNNRYNANTTHLRTTGELRYDNLFQRSQSFSFQYQVAPERTADAKIWSASYVIPTSGPFVWALYAVHSDSNVAAVGSLDVIGKGNIYGLRLISTLPTSDPSFYHSLTLGLDYKDFKQSVIQHGATQSVDSPIRYPPFTLDYSATWLGPLPAAGSTGRAATAGARSSTSLDVGLNFLIQGFDTDWRQFAAKRAGAGTSYIVLHPSISREQVLPAHWSVVAKLDGQLANGPLINNEQFSAGGADTVRGYVEAERLADNAVHGTLELRTPQLLAGTAAKIDQSYLFLFTDAAKLWIQQPLASQEKQFTLASAGLGLRFKSHGFTVALDGARTLKPGFVTRAARMRGVFDVSYAY
jgi:hemolysin activation/secretion protein